LTAAKQPITSHIINGHKKAFFLASCMPHIR
jgi:hypothetical protein